MTPSASLPRVYIDGEAGTTGLQIRSRLEGRADLQLLSIDPARRKDPQARAELLNRADVAVLCLHDDAAREALSLMSNPATRVLDASSAHRTAPGWVYGFPELSPTQPQAIRKARLVSNPGCYATGAVALLAPLVAAGLLPADLPLGIQGLSGYSGGGRPLVEAHESGTSHPLAGPLRVYGLGLDHKHRPEIQAHAGLVRPPLFTPVVGGWRQGMLVQVPLPVGTVAASAAQLRETLQGHYAGQRFVQVYAEADNPSHLDPKVLNGSNLLELFVYSNPGGDALLVARLDNLGKGASGAAVQNLDLMLGLDDGQRDYAVVGEVTVP